MTRERFLRELRKRLLVYGGILVVLGLALRHNCRCPGTGGGSPPSGDMGAMAQRLEADVRHLTGTIGERNVGNDPENLDRAADWILARWREVGLEPREYPYEAGGRTCRNLEVDVTGDDAAPILLVGAHYDSPLGSPGADDNGSGVAVLLELARAFAGVELPCRLRLVAFTNEEMPWFYTELMGSMVYARMARARNDPIRAMISVETVGYYDETPGSQEYPTLLKPLYPDRGNFVGVVGCLTGRDLVVEVAGALRRSTDVPVECASVWYKVPGVSLSDHSSFWKVGYPAVMITDTAMYRNFRYHSAIDGWATLDYPRFARVTAGIAGAVRILAAGAAGSGSR